MTSKYEDFAALDIRTGVIIGAEEFPEARRPAYKLQIDFGPEIGIKKTSAQITTTYSLDELPGKRVVAIVNFPVKQIGNFFSEVLVLGAVNAADEVILLTTDIDCERWLRIA